MATFTLFNSWKERLTEDVNLQSDQFTIALCNAANAPVVTDTILANLTEIAYTNLNARDLTTTAAAISSGAQRLILADFTLSASGGASAAFRYVVIYDNTTTDDALVGFADYGSDITLLDGEQLNINFDDVNGLLAIA